MRRDPTQFRERFKRWKEGEQVYDKGLPKFEDGKWNPNDTYTADAGMIKSKLAIASHFGNPTARRMTNYDGRDYTWSGEYEYINGIGEPKRGNVYVGSYDNLVTPLIQDNGKTLELVDDPWNPKNEQRSYKQSLKFNKMRDAWSFGENYKKYAPMMNLYEDGKMPKYEDGKKPTVVGEYNVYPSAIGASELNVTTPEVVVTGKDSRPLYLRYAAERSTFDPNAIRNFTDWIPIVGDIGTGIDIKNAIQNNNYLEASTLGAMMVLPDPIARGTKKLFRPISKKVKRLFQNVDFTSPLNVRVPEAENQTWAEITAEKYADKIATKNSIPATKEEKEQFKRAWDIATRNEPIKSVQELTSGFIFANEKDKHRFVNLINRNPEYYEFLRRERISDPLSQESVSKFLDNQFTSVRGVVADNADDALPMLTDTQRGRVMRGGDRLDTYGGVYTSNSTTIADRFKNPQGTKIGNGYVAKVKYPYNISTDIPIEDLLEQYRKMILLSDRKNPLYGTKYYDKLKKDPNVVALESDYIGRASNGDKSVQERAYLPTGNVGEQKHTLDIVDLKEYRNQSDLHGRWLAEPETGSKAGLFIPRMLNNYSDFIRSARVVLSPQRNKELYRKTLREAEDNFSKQNLRRAELTSKLYNTQRKLKNIATAGGALSPVGALFGYGVYRTKEENKFYDSPEFQQLLEDPNYEKYSNLDDGTFWKRSSIDKLIHKYKTKYHRRIKGK